MITLTGPKPDKLPGRGLPLAAVELDRVAEAAAAAGLELEQVSGAGTQFCYVLARRTQATAAS